MSTALTKLTGNAITLSEADLILGESPLADTEAFDFVPSTLSVASSGAKAFVDENDEMVKAPITGVILGAVKTRGLWVIDDEKIPLCSSIGGVVGRIRQGIYSKNDISQKELDAALRSFARPHPGIVSLDVGEVLQPEYPCVGCPMNDWNTALKGNSRGKACSEKRRLLFLNDEWSAPVLLNVPTMSIRNFNTYVSGLQTKMKGARYYGVRTRIDVTKEENASGNPYGQLSFKFVERITDPDMARAILEVQRQLANFLTTQPVIADEYDMPPSEDAPGEAEKPARGKRAKVDARTGEIITEPEPVDDEAEQTSIPF